MKTAKRLAVFIMCLSAIFSLFGCRDKHILDGPGMENVPKWKKLEISRSDSYCQNNFWFVLQETDFSASVIGECRDEEGELYELEEAVILSYEDYGWLRNLELDTLPDVFIASEVFEADGVLGREAEEFVDAPTVLDAPSISLLLTYSDGVTVEKGGDVDRISLQMYEKLLPYFKNSK